MERPIHADERNSRADSSVEVGRAGVPAKKPNLWVAGRLVSDANDTAAALKRVRKPARSTSASPQCDARDLDALEKTATAALAEFRVQEAIELFGQALHEDPTRPGAHAGLGGCYLQLRDYDLALRHFEQALDVRPDLGRALYGASNCLLELGRLHEAASYARRQASLEDKENRARGLYVLGLVARAQGAWEEAIAHLEESLRIHPHRRRGPGPGRFEIRHRYELALCYRELNQPERALDHLRWAASHARRSRPIVLDLANVYLELGRYKQAEHSFRTLLDADSNDRQAHLGVGRVHLATQDYKAAIRSFSEVLSKVGNDLDALNGMAEASKGLGDLNRAAGYLEKIRQLYRMPQAQLERRLRSLENERQRRDAELLRMRNIAALNIMATGIAHELRQPLTVIRLAAQNARRDLTKGNVSLLDSDLADIDANVLRLDKIIAVLRDAGSDEMRVDEIVDLSEVIDGAMSLFRNQLAHRNIEVILPQATTIRALGSRVALQQVVINLISNARDALTDAREKKIQLRVFEAQKNVIIEVQDTGCGMSEPVRDRALDPFFTTKQNGGTGLGLYICYNLVRQMHGSLKIKETSVGRGTTFELTLQRVKEKTDD